MPLNRCEDDGKPGWKWGDSGACYTYKAGDEASEKAARDKAMAQAAAMGEFPGTGQQRRSTPLEIFYRSSAMATEDVNFKDRMIDVVAMPWGVEAEIVWRGGTWKEVFERGSFDEQMQQKVRIPTNREHMRGDTVGRVVHMQDDSKRLLASVKIAKTDRGDETLQLAAEGMLGASVGYYLKRLSDVLIDRKTMTRRVRRARMDHLALTESPAYPGAETIAVHDDLTPHPMAGLQPLAATPAIDEWLADPIHGWLASRRDT